MTISVTNFELHNLLNLLKYLPEPEFLPKVVFQNKMRKLWAKARAPGPAQHAGKPQIDQTNDPGDLKA